VASVVLLEFAQGLCFFGTNRKRSSGVKKKPQFVAETGPEVFGRYADTILT